MIIYYSESYMDGPDVEDITGCCYAEACDVAEAFGPLNNYVIYVGY